MTDKNENIPNELTQLQDDALLEQKLRAAYDAIDPTPEQEERMLSALLKAQAELDGAGGHDADDVAEAGGEAGSAGAAGPRPKRSGTFKIWKVAVPLAACLAVGAVLVGVAGPLNVNHAENTPSAESIGVDDGQALKSGDGAAEAATESATDSTTDESGAMTLEIEGGTNGTTVMAQSYEADGYVEEPGLEPEPVQDFNTEEYDALEERGFVSTTTSPLSTVSADVDTASYCNVRRMINEGMPLADLPAGSVRIEEMLNYFHYDYAEPSGNDKFSMQAQSGQCPWNEDTQLLVMGFATSPESATASKGSNLVFLVDVSGSMNSPDKLELLQDSFATLLESLGPNDRVSIVTYADGEEIVLEGASGDDDRAILRAIYKLHADGSTNGEAGLKQAYEVAERNFIEGGVNRIIMASDGDLNVGMTSESELHDYVDEQRERGVYLSVLGFGSGNYKDNKMETLADHGNGSYHYIDCIEEAERVLRDNLTANLVPFADDVKVQVEFNPAQVKAYRLIGYENRALADEDFRDDTVDAGDVGPNAQFTVAYEVVLADSKMDLPETELKYDASDASDASYENASTDWLTCTLRYHDFADDAVREQQLVVDASSIAAEPFDDWKFAAAVIEFGMLARGSDYAGTSSFDSILSLLGTNLPDDRAAFKQLVEKARP